MSYVWVRPVAKESLPFLSPVKCRVTLKTALRVCFRVKTLELTYELTTMRSRYQVLALDWTSELTDFITSNSCR
jgi:hypothetical protein